MDIISLRNSWLLRPPPTNHCYTQFWARRRNVQVGVAARMASVSNVHCAELRVWHTVYRCCVGLFLRFFRQCSSTTALISRLRPFPRRRFPFLCAVGSFLVPIQLLQEDLRHPDVRKAMEHWTGHNRLSQDDADALMEDNYRYVGLLSLVCCFRTRDGFLGSRNV